MITFLLKKKEERYYLIFNWFNWFLKMWNRIFSNLCNLNDNELMSWRDYKNIYKNIYTNMKDWISTMQTVSWEICVKKLSCKQIVSLFLRITVTSEEDRRAEREFECLDYPRIQKARGPVQRKLGCCKDKQVCLSSLIWLLSSTFNSILASNWKLCNFKKKKNRFYIQFTFSMNSFANS